MSRLTATLAEYASTRYGVVNDAELAAHGITPSRRDRLVVDGLLVVMFRGVYRLRSNPESFEARCRAICLVDPTAWITGRAAGRLWNLRQVGDADLIEVRVPHFSQSLDVAYIRRRRCNAMEAIDVVERPDGIRVVSAPRLAFDLAACLDDLALESVIEQIIDRRLCTAHTLIATGRRLYHGARPGSTRFARVMEARPTWMKPADSHLEVRLFDALRSAGLGGLVRQHRIELPGGWAIHADLAVPGLRWAIAVDHITWHGGRVAQDRDKQNDRQAGAIGWRVDRVSDGDIEHRLSSTVAELLRIHDVLRSAVTRRAG